MNRYEERDGVLIGIRPDGSEFVASDEPDVEVTIAKVEVVGGPEDGRIDSLEVLEVRTDDGQIFVQEPPPEGR
jgi:hypothetical protein